MTKEELKNYIKDQIKDLETNGQKEIERAGDDGDYMEGRIEGSKYAYLDLLDMIDQLKEG